MMKASEMSAAEIATAIMENPKNRELPIQRLLTQVIDACIDHAWVDEELETSLKACIMNATDVDYEEEEEEDFDF